MTTQDQRKCCAKCLEEPDAMRQRMGVVKVCKNIYCSCHQPPQEWVKDFMDFWYERGMYDGRSLGAEQYINFISNLLEQKEKEVRKETMLGLRKEWLYRRNLFTESPLRHAVDNLVGGITKQP